MRRAKSRSGVVFFDVDDPETLARLHESAVDRRPGNRVRIGTLDPLLFQKEAFRTGDAGTD